MILVIDLVFADLASLGDVGIGKLQLILNRWKWVTDCDVLAEEE